MFNIVTRNVLNGGTGPYVEGEFTIRNTGSVDLEVTDVWTAVEDTAWYAGWWFYPGDSTPVTVVPGDSVDVYLRATSQSYYEADIPVLAGTVFRVTTDCGSAREFEWSELS